MWNWRKKKKDNIDIKAEGSEHIQDGMKALKDKTGFTLVELMVAVAVFSLMIVPLMSGFVVSNRINSKGRQKEQALTIAQDLMEGIKAFGLESLAQQIDEGPITIVSNGSAEKSVSGTEASGAATYDSTNGFQSNTYGGSVLVEFVYSSAEDTDGDGVDDVAAGDSGSEYVYTGVYKYYLEDILMGSTYYDAYITITQNKDNTYLISQTSYYQTFFSTVAMNSMKYYDVTIDVYLSDEVSGHVNDNGYRASYTGTFFDNN